MKKVVKYGKVWDMLQVLEKEPGIVQAKTLYRGVEGPTGIHTHLEQSLSIDRVLLWHPAVQMH